MGDSAIATCPCGYDSGELMVGCGDSGPTCFFPAFCKEGNHLVEIDLYEPPLRCPEGHPGDPVPYKEASMVKTLGSRLVVDCNWPIEGQGNELTNGSYFCPACHQFTLTFQEGNALWD